MNDSTIFVLIFAVGILGGIALYGRRCERRIAREARLAAAAPDELVNGETTVEEVQEEASEMPGEAEPT